MNISPEIQQAVSELAQAVRHGTVRQTEIAQATGVNQGQVSRILSGKVTRPSANLHKLYEFALLRSPKTGDRVSVEKDLTEVLMRIWDGTPAHAQVLKEILVGIEKSEQLAQFRKIK